MTCGHSVVVSEVGVKANERSEGPRGRARPAKAGTKSEKGQGKRLYGWPRSGDPEAAARRVESPRRTTEQRSQNHHVTSRSSRCAPR